ncbi:MAG: hypothetical protein OXI67_00920 [Candidatus Poribacteria bacterium]|nr:hypothetical protein [Candidatus Poribacteria bacterium]
MQFGLCLNNEGYAASLEVRKVYRVVPDDKAAVHGYICVIDESGEDYAYTNVNSEKSKNLWCKENPFSIMK